MSWRLCLFVSFLYLIWPALGATCQPRAVSLPLKRYVLETRSEARGISLKIGSPTPQQMVMTPSAWYTDTYLWSVESGNCPDEWSPEVCVTYRGGQYDETRSDTSVRGRTLSRVGDDTMANWTTDNIQLENTTLGTIDLPQFEFGVRNQSANLYVPKGELGLARDSTFLKTLLDGNRTSSNSWSLYWGSEVTNPPRDGSITLGGYDEALIQNSRNISAELDRTDDRCKEGMIVQITGLSLSTPDGSQDVMRGLGRLEACVIPSVNHLLTVPVRYWDAMASIMDVELHSFRNGTAETYFYDTTIVTGESATYSGNLTITLNDTLTVTIPNEQLIFNETFIAANVGTIQTKPDIKDIPIVRRDDIMPRIGGLFFSAAYLMVNHDKNTFTIAEALPTPVKQRLVGIDTANDCIAAANVVGADPASSSPSTPTASSGSGSSDNFTPSSGGLSGGAIAGIAVGVVGGLGVLAGAAFLLWRRRRRSSSLSGSANPLNPNNPLEKYGYNTSEMSGVNPAMELAHQDERQYAVELDGSNRPAEAPHHEALSPRPRSG